MNYEKMNSLNKKLREKEKNYEPLSFIDYYMFHLSSFALSLYRDCSIRKRENDEHVTLSSIFLMRSIIEDISVITFYRKDNPLDCEKLIKDFWAIKEYLIYKDYSIFNTILFDFESIKKNYDIKSEEYKEKFREWGLNSKEVNKKLVTIVPFLKSGYSIKKLIKEYVPEFEDVYERISICIHPVSLLINYDEQIPNYTEIITAIFSYADEYLNEYYPNIDPNIQDSFEYEYDAYYNNGITKNKHIINSESQIQILESISSTIKQYSNKNEYDIHIVFLDKIISILRSVAIDRAFGFSEIIKAKFKVYSELCSTYYFLLSKNKGNEFEDYKFLMKYFTLWQFNDSYSNELNEAFIIYKKHYNEIDIKNFEEKLSKDLPTFLGFTSIREFVFNMYKGMNYDAILASLCEVLYNESQAFSHGNGYLLSSMDGSFMDYMSTMQMMDLLLSKLLFIYVENEKNKYSNEIHIGNKHKKYFSDLSILLEQYNKSIYHKKIIDFILYINGRFI